MAKKIFTYRGKTLEELQALSIKDLTDLLPSSQRRKLKRGLSDNEKKLVEDLKKGDNVKTQLRDMIVLPSMVGKTIKVHSGKEYHAVLVQDEAIGCRLGELVLSKKRVQHSSPGVGSTKSSSNVSVK
ncbi:30S ribosomal protein S19 [Candidatus Woesearchaeota archaeon CG10_big_fil_rev_8_21_14_0_10_32_9]|nr:MAG: 30S ribosomal protein S19 [Candidatus Woesearchaeota archaeon CG10_big_fil_rev_8_21_14_0_10_32_9]